jgi:hypothetical protein
MSLNLLHQDGFWSPTIATAFDPKADAVILEGDTAETLKAVPSGSLKLIITSPPYNRVKKRP